MDKNLEPILQPDDQAKQKKMRADILKLLEERYREALAEEELEDRKYRSIAIQKNNEPIKSNDIKVRSL